MSEPHSRPKKSSAATWHIPRLHRAREALEAMLGQVRETI